MLVRHRINARLVLPEVSLQLHNQLALLGDESVLRLEGAVELIQSDLQGNKLSVHLFRDSPGNDIRVRIQLGALGFFLSATGRRRMLRGLCFSRCWRGVASSS